MYHDEHVLIYKLISSPGNSMNSRTTHRRWEDDGVKNPRVASRISVVTNGVLNVTHYHDFDRTDPYYTDVRNVGDIGGTHRNSKGYTTQDPATPATEWHCVYLKGKKVKDGTVPTYFTGNANETLALLPKEEQNLLVLLSGTLRVAGEPDIQDHISIRGDLGLAKTMRCLTPCQFLHITIEDETDELIA